MKPKTKSANEERLLELLAQAWDCACKCDRENTDPNREVDFKAVANHALDALVHADSIFDELA